MESKLARKLIKQRAFFIYCFICFFLAAGMLLMILGDVILRGALAIWRIGPSIFLEIPRGIPIGTQGGISNAIMGTLMLIGIASLWIPVGLGIGIFLVETRGMLSRLVRMCMDTLAWIPSIVWGMLGYAIFVVGANFRFSLLAGGLTLGLVLIPYISRYTEESLRMVPAEIREAGFSLGARRWMVMFQITMKAAIAGILAGAAIAFARILGETAPLLFTSYWNNLIPGSLFDPAASLPYLIWYYSQFPYEEMHSRAYAAALILIAIVLGFMLASRAISRMLRIYRW